MNMSSSWVKEKGTTHVMYIAKLKDGLKRVKQTFSMILESFFSNGMIEGEKIGSHKKGFLNLKCLSPLKMLTSPLFEETLGVFLSLPLFFWLRLGDLGVLMIFEEKITSSKTSFQMA
jgi:hypothetical protein